MDFSHPLPQTTRLLNAQNYLHPTDARGYDSTKHTHTIKTVQYISLSSWKSSRLIEMQQLR